MTISDDVRAAAVTIWNDRADTTDPKCEWHALSVRLRSHAQALADGRTACVERRTEAECRAEFVKRFGSCPSAEMYARDWQSEWVGYIACARANGLVKP